MRYIVALVVCILACTPARSDAYDQALAQQVATAAYGTPCGDAVTIGWDHLGPGINARSTWMAEAGAGPETYGACTITYNYDVTWDWPKFCTVTEHEYGHLTGHQHDESMTMATYYDQPSAECVAALPPAAPVAAVESKTSSHALDILRRRCRIQCMSFKITYTNPRKPSAVVGPERFQKSAAFHRVLKLKVGEAIGPGPFRSAGYKRIERIA